MSESEPWRFLTLRNGEKVKIDSADFEKANQHKWYMIQQKNSGKRQAVTNLKTKNGYKQVTLGKFLMNPPQGKMVYPRRSREILDYRRQNLIVCTMRERQIMLPKRKSNCSSPFKGVAWEKSRGKWRAHIDIKGQTRTIGYFDDEIAAALAYNKKARELYGDIAYQNNVKNLMDRRSQDGK